MFRIELAKFATKDRFAALARDFFARLTHKTLDYYISRALPSHVGPDRGLASLEQSDRFRAALQKPLPRSRPDRRELRRGLVLQGKLHRPAYAAGRSELHRLRPQEDAR